MAQLDRNALAVRTTIARTALRWINALTALATVVAVALLAWTGNSQYIELVIAIGAGAVLAGGIGQVCVHFHFHR